MPIATFTIPADGTITWVGDAHHKGSDVYYCERMRRWVIVDLENRDVEFADRLVAYRSTADGDETGLHNSCVACDLDGVSGLWVVAFDSDDDANPEREDVDIVWDSAAE